MVLKRRINYQWRIFIPVTICLWAVIFGMFKWEESRVRDVRNEMAQDLLSSAGANIVSAYDRGDTIAVAEFCEFVNRYYDESVNYDPMVVWVKDIETDQITDRFGSSISAKFTDLPKARTGHFVVDRKYLTDSDEDITMVYTTHVSPSSKKKVYVMLPDTKRLKDITDSRTTYFWLIFVVIGLIATIVTYISTSYFAHNIKILKNFVTQASTNPNFVITDYKAFPHDELGDISREIVKIYNQRTQEIKRSAHEHEIALNAIMEKERVKRELTGNINHELKTPVGVIQGYLDTLVNNPDLPADLRDSFILKAQQNSHRLTQLIADITAITKLECGGKMVDVGEINFHNLVYAFEDFLKEGNVLQGKMSFHFDIPLNCMVKGNEGLLRTVLLNFVKNSVAYSEGTECNLIYLREDDDFYYFKYYDNGIGVPPEHLPHMFERFYRVNAGRSRNAGGTGLGLAIVEVTIKAFGGAIDVLNHFPTGLEFTFSLPKYKKAARQTSPEETSPEETPADKPEEKA